MPHRDEGYTDDEPNPNSFNFPIQDVWVKNASLQDKEELAYKLLSSLPIPNLAKLQRKIAPLLQLDIIGLLPSELSLYIFSYLQYHDLLECALVSHRWRLLADDPSLWKRLCAAQGWQWRESPKSRVSDFVFWREYDDEGVGEDEDDWVGPGGFASLPSRPSSPSQPPRLSRYHCRSKPPLRPFRNSAPPALPSGPQTSKPNYKLLHQTHVLLRNRFLQSSYRLTYLRRCRTPNSHTSAIYCLQLYTFPDFPNRPGRQVLFTGSRDQTICQWDISRGIVERVLHGVHKGSVLSLCARNNLLASGSIDKKVAVWDLETGEVIKVIEDHLDSVLCVRTDETRLVSCSKDRTIRTYLFPNMAPHLVLNSHRAAVNAISISQNQIVSASGDRSVRIWDAGTGMLLHCFEHHHTRGIASIAFAPPYILSGSSDTHLRSFNVLTSHGWTTPPYIETYTQATFPSIICQVCSSSTVTDGGTARRESLKVSRGHKDLVRSVTFRDNYVVSGSYDKTIKVWDRSTGALVADLMGGHSGKIFSVSVDCAKIVSCGEDGRICIWDFAHGVDTSFIKL